VAVLRERINLMESTAWGTWAVGYSPEQAKKVKTLRCPDSDSVVFDEAAFCSGELNLGYAIVARGETAWGPGG